VPACRTAHGYCVRNVPPLIRTGSSAGTSGPDLSGGQEPVTRGYREALRHPLTRDTVERRVEDAITGHSSPTPCARRYKPRLQVIGDASRSHRCYVSSIERSTALSVNTAASYSADTMREAPSYRRRGATKRTPYVAQPAARIACTSPRLNPGPCLTRPQASRINPA